MTAGVASRKCQGECRAIINGKRVPDSFGGLAGASKWMQRRHNPQKCRLATSEWSNSTGVTSPDSAQSLAVLRLVNDSLSVTFGIGFSKHPGGGIVMTDPLARAGQPIYWRDRVNGGDAILNNSRSHTGNMLA
jgi:hypothetical protein